MSKVKSERGPALEEPSSDSSEVASFRALVMFCFLICVLMMQVWLVCETTLQIFFKLLLLCALQHVNVTISNVFKRMVLALHLALCKSYFKRLRRGDNGSGAWVSLGAVKWQRSSKSIDRRKLRSKHLKWGRNGNWKSKKHILTVALRQVSGGRGTRWHHEDGPGGAENRRLGGKHLDPILELPLTLLTLPWFWRLTSGGAEQARPWIWGPCWEEGPKSWMQRLTQCLHAKVWNPQLSFSFQLPESVGHMWKSQMRSCFRGLYSREPDWLRETDTCGSQEICLITHLGSLWLMGFAHTCSFQTAFQCFMLKCEQTASLLNMKRAKDYQVCEERPKQFSQEKATRRK